MKSGFSDPIISNTVTSFIFPKDKVRLHDVVSDQPHLSGASVGCVLSMPKYHMLKLQV